jgi:hypothetical protein
MPRKSLGTVAITLTVALSANAQSSEHPARLAPDGVTPLPRVAQATRFHLLGADEIYGLAIYLAEPLDLTRLASPDVSKALRIEFRYKDDLRRGISLDWQRELVPKLEPAATAHLRGAFAPLKQGDVVLIEYVPGKGTSIRVNRSVAVAAAHHDLMLAFLDRWLGQRPVSEEMKRRLLGSS